MFVSASDSAVETVGTELSPSSSFVAYLSFALSSKVSLSSVFVLVPIKRCLSRDALLLKPRVHPSLGQRNNCVSVSTLSSFSTSTTVANRLFALVSFGLEVISLKLPGEKLLEIFS